MKSTAASPYSKMYLVTPSVYQILKNCISDKEKIVTDGLNATEIEKGQTPAEKIVSEIAQKDFNEPTIATQIVEEQLVPPSTNPTDVIFSEQYNVPTEKIPKEQEKLVYSNPLTTPCEQDNPEGGIIPSMLYKQKNISEEIIPKTKLLQPKIVLTRVNPQQCNVCMKLFTRKWDLKRHLTSVHKNIINPPIETPQILEDDDVEMKEQQNQSFDNWSAGTTRSGKKFVNMDTSTPTLRGKRTAKVAKLGSLKIPPKSRPEGGEESNNPDTFPHWA